MNDNIDWKTIADEKTAELRRLYAEIAGLKQDLGIVKGREDARKRQAFEISFLRAENALLKYDLKKQEQ